MANIGPIPGYYYDEDKKKYFKVQANHIAPADAKYSKTNVIREKRETKKRKLDDRAHEKRVRQTVRRSRILLHPLAGGVGLQREQGSREPVVDLSDRDAFFVSQLRPDRTVLVPRFGEHRPISLFDVNRTANGDMLVGVNQSGTSSVWVWPGEVASTQNQIVLDDDAFVAAAFSSPLVSIDAVTHDDMSPALVVCTQEPHATGNVSLSGLPCMDCGNTPDRPSVVWQLGVRDSSLWASALQPTSRHLAISGTDDVFVLDIASTKICNQLNLRSESRAIAWLDPQTIAYGLQGGRVGLWDTRSSGRATRFKHRTSPITALLSPNDSGTQLLVADNRRLDLYDTRMERSPVFGFEHLHQGPQLRADCRDGLVAALDYDNTVQIYSLRTGRTAGKLMPLPLAARPLVTSVRWLDEDGRPALHTCHGRTLTKWSFGGAKDDEG